MKSRNRLAVAAWLMLLLAGFSAGAAATVAAEATGITALATAIAPPAKPVVSTRVFRCMSAAAWRDFVRVGLVGAAWPNACALLSPTTNVWAPEVVNCSLEATEKQGCTQNGGEADVPVGALYALYAPKSAGRNPTETTALTNEYAARYRVRLLIQAARK